MTMVGCQSKLLYKLPINTDFRIGFERTLIVVSEGENVNLTIEQTNNVIGQLRSSDVLGIPIINNVPGTAGG